MSIENDKQRIETYAPQEIDKKYYEEIFDTSIFLFKNRRFIEDEPVPFLKGRVLLKAFNSSEKSCKIFVSQMFSEKKENTFNLVKGSLLPINIGDKEYVFSFVNGKYREYCIIDSYYHDQ